MRQRTRPGRGAPPLFALSSGHDDGSGRSTFPSPARWSRRTGAPRSTSWSTTSPIAPARTSSPERASCSVGSTALERLAPGVRARAICRGSCAATISRSGARSRTFPSATARRSRRNWEPARFAGDRPRPRSMRHLRAMSGTPTWLLALLSRRWRAYHPARGRAAYGAFYPELEGRRDPRRGRLRALRPAASTRCSWAIAGAHARRSTRRARASSRSRTAGRGEGMRLLVDNAIYLRVVVPRRIGVTRRRTRLWLRGGRARRRLRARRLDQRGAVGLRGRGSGAARLRKDPPAGSSSPGGHVFFTTSPPSGEHFYRSQEIDRAVTGPPARSGGTSSRDRRRARGTAAAGAHATDHQTLFNRRARGGRAAPPPARAPCARRSTGRWCAPMPLRRPPRCGPARRARGPGRARGTLRGLKRAR